MAQNNKLHYWRKLHKLLYNACVSHRITEYKQFGKSINYFNQQNCLPQFKECWTEYKELGSHALQATVKRVDYSFQRFFKLKSGFPKYKSSRRYKGWTYPCKAGWKACSSGKNGDLKLSNLGNIKMRGKARDWGTPKTCTILFKQGKWYASITIDCVPSRVQTDSGAIGLDFGTHHAVAYSDGTIIDNPRFIKQSQEKVNQLAKKSRRKRAPVAGAGSGEPRLRRAKSASSSLRHRGAMSANSSSHNKRIRPSISDAPRFSESGRSFASRRWKKANRAVAKIQSKVARQRQDWQHKLASEIVSCNSLVATEKLNLKNLTRKAKRNSKRKRQKTGLNRNLLDVGIGNLKSLIKYKVTEAGGIYIEVPTRKLAPSQTCPGCAIKRKKDAL